MGDKVLAVNGYSNDLMSTSVALMKLSTSLALLSTVSGQSKNRYGGTLKESVLADDSCCGKQ